MAPAPATASASTNAISTSIIPTAEEVVDTDWAYNEDGEVYFTMNNRDVTFHYRRQQNREQNNETTLEHNIVQNPDDLSEDWLFKGKLLRVKGTSDNIILKEKRLKRNSLNSGDVFILDTALNLYIWVGNKSNKHEQEAARVFAKSLVDHRKINMKILLINEGEGEREKSFLEKIPEQKSVLGVPVGKYKQKPISKARKDESMRKFRKKLFRLKDSKVSPNGFLFYLVSSGNLKNENNVNRRKLDSSDVFILDEGFKIWVWIGKTASKTEKEVAVKYAQRYLQKGKRPSSLPIVKIEDGKEPAEFFEHFGHFNDGKCNIF